MHTRGKANNFQQQHKHRKHEKINSLRKNWLGNLNKLTQSRFLWPLPLCCSIMKFVILSTKIDLNSKKKSNIKSRKINLRVNTNIRHSRIITTWRVYWRAADLSASWTTRFFFKFKRRFWNVLISLPHMKTERDSIKKLRTKSNVLSFFGKCRAKNTYMLFLTQSFWIFWIHIFFEIRTATTQRSL